MCVIPTILRYDAREERGRMRRGVWVARPMTSASAAPPDEFITFAAETSFHIGGLSFAAGLLNWGPEGQTYVVLAHPLSGAATVVGHHCAPHVHF